MRVLKFGGTSLGDACRMQNVAEIVNQQGRVVVVLSAVAGTTDSLVKIVNFLKQEKRELASQIVEQLMVHYEQYANQLFSSDENKLTAAKFIKQQLTEIREIIGRPFKAISEFELLAKGEIISTQLFYLFLIEQDVKVSLLSALDFLRLNDDGAPDEEYLETALSTLLKQNSQTQIFVTQGFICRNASGEVSNLQRGGSDYSASLFAAAIGCEEVQIWTDIDGMHNNDPRFIENTRPIRELSFDEAAELAYFGAKILHPSSIKPARKKNIPVKLLNTLEPTAQGTIISSVSTQARIKAVAAKDGITAIKIKSSEMLQAPGFLRRVFEVFESHKTSIDAITTSEVAVSLTIDDTSYLDLITQSLAEFSHVEVDKNMSIICVVGEFVMESSGVASQVISSLKDIPIRMISYGGSAHNITLLISEDLKVKALNALHKGLFNT
ncbi:aspartate kinase [Aliikangiella sp. IMCC44359]|uniref:aspartate kinase n=1 Tax=Aliikangiella sp. IMCC44359 TaxID=3459125 RepID=UPI00403AF104